MYPLSAGNVRSDVLCAGAALFARGWKGGGTRIPRSDWYRDGAVGGEGSVGGAARRALTNVFRTGRPTRHRLSLANNGPLGFGLPYRTVYFDLPDVRFAFDDTDTMNFVRLIPAILSALLLAAHFVRMGSPILVILALMLPWLLFFPQGWAARFVQVALIYGTIEWVRTLWVFVAERSEAGQPWTRLAIILGVVALFTAGSAMSFSLSRPLRRRYGLDKASVQDVGFIKEEG